jgi:hypothetical protein
MRVGRLSHVPENWIVSCTNPDSPTHWAYKHFFVDKTDTKHVYLSRTEDNPYLPKQYIEQLKLRLDPKMARRMLYGEWIEIASDAIYHAYVRDRNIRDQPYEINPKFPIHLTHDFNIGDGKPMSAVCFQYIGGVFHFFNEVVIDTADTEQVYIEWENRGLFENLNTFKIHGDATGKNRDTRSKSSDYEIIRSFMSRYRRRTDKFKAAGTVLNFEIDVPLKNPPIRTRHNRVNAHCYSEAKETRLYVYASAKTLDEGFRLTQLKPGGEYLEKETRSQHITTAAGYGIMSVTTEPAGMEEFNRWQFTKF